MEKCYGATTSTEPSKSLTKTTAAVACGARAVADTRIKLNNVGFGLLQASVLGINSVLSKYAIDAVVSKITIDANRP